MGQPTIHPLEVGPAPGFNHRLGEIEMFFQKRSPQHKALARLARRLEKANIPYAVMGGMAVNAHGAERTTNDINVLLTPEGLQEFRDRFVGKTYESLPNRSRRFREKKSGVGVDILLTGNYPGRGEPGPLAFPPPMDVAVTIDNKKVIGLQDIIQFKLAARRYYDFGDVVALIRTNNLNESFKEKLHPSVQDDYIECLEEKLREDEYEAREM